MMKPTTKTVSRERQLLALICQGLDDKKAGDLKILDVRGISSITDYIVIATGLAEPHLRAMRIEIERVLDEQKATIGGMDKNQQSGWLVVDAYQIMVHLFTAEARTRYGLEQLWRDGRELPLPVVLGLEPEREVAEPVKDKPVTEAAPRRKAAAKAKKKPVAAKRAVAKKPAAKAKKAPAKKVTAPKAAPKKKR